MPLCLPPLPHRVYTIYTCLPPVRPSSFTYMSCLPPPTLMPSRLLSFSSNTSILSFFFMHVCFPHSSYFICFLQAFLLFLPAGHPIVFFFPPTSSSGIYCTYTVLRAKIIFLKKVHPVKRARAQKIIYCFIIQICLR
jgi:hypothetical protein